MKRLAFLFVLLIFTAAALKADETNPALTKTQKIYTKADISRLAGAFINNNVNVKNPAVVDIDKDGIFDILNFTEEGTVEYYRNTGSNENPVFTLENPKFDNYEVNSFMSSGMPVPVFFADKDGDGDVDVFAVVDSKFDKSTQQRQYKVTSLENTMQLDHYTLITIILILVIIVLVAILVK